MPVLSMISNSAPEVEINLPAAEYIRREQFDRYRCTFDIYPEQTYLLKLISVTPKANANQLYTMRLQLITDNRPVPSPGMNTMVTILCNNDSSRNLSVPGSAVLQKDGKACVFVYNPSDSKVHSREVTLGTPAEQRTQHHRFRRAATRRPSGVGRNTSHKGRRNRDSSACCQRHKHRRTVIALFSFKTAAIMDISKWAFKNRNLVYFLVTVLFVGGILSCYQMSELEDPEIKVKLAMVVTTYPGASAHQVELEVTDVLEKSIRSMGNIDNVESYSYNDLSLIQVELTTITPDDEVEQCWDMLRRKVSDVQRRCCLTERAPAIVKDDFGNVYGMFYALTGDGLYRRGSCPTTPSLHQARNKRHGRA